MTSASENSNMEECVNIKMTPYTRMYCILGIIICTYIMYTHTHLLCKYNRHEINNFYRGQTINGTDYLLTVNADGS